VENENGILGRSPVALRAAQGTAQVGQRGCSFQGCVPGPLGGRCVAVFALGFWVEPRVAGPVVEVLRVKCGFLLVYAFFVQKKAPATVLCGGFGF